MVEHELKKNAIGMWKALAQGLGTNGPAAVTALFFVGLAGMVGGSLPLVVFLSWIIYIGMTVIVYEWSKIQASSHGWAGIQKKGLGIPFAFYGTWGYWYYYLTGATGFAVLGFSSFAYVLFPSLGAKYPWLWIPISLIVISLTFLLVYLGINPSASYQLYTGIAEVAFIIITSISLVFIAGGHNTLSVFSARPVGGDWTLIFIAMILGITTFGGMNSVIPVAEETKNPKKNIPRALLVLTIILGFTLILSSYAQTVVYGVGNMFNYASLPDPGVLIYEKYFGAIVAGIYAIFVLNSFFSSSIAFTNNTIRMAYGTARENIIFPKSFMKVNKFGIPYINLIVTVIIEAAIALITGLLLGPLMAGIFLIVSNSFFNYTNHMLAGIGIARYHYKHKSLKIFRHVIIPVLVIIALAIAIIYAIYPAPAPPLNFAAYVAGVWILLGIIVYLYIRSKKPEDLRKLGDYSI
ncbi:MAG: APC family permease [Thermoproteota archaeon]